MNGDSHGDELGLTRLQIQELGHWSCSAMCGYCCRPTSFLQCQRQNALRAARPSRCFSAKIWVCRRATHCRGYFVAPCQYMQMVNSNLLPSSFAGSVGFVGVVPHPKGGLREIQYPFTTTPPFASANEWSERKCSVLAQLKRPFRSANQSAPRRGGHRRGGSGPQRRRPIRPAAAAPC